MSYTLSMSGVIVGRTELETRDAANRVARGAFRPALGYELAQPVFELFDQAGGDDAALARYRRARDALRLQLVDAAGAPISVRDVNVRRTSAATGGVPTYEIEVATDAPQFWSTAGG